MILEDFIKNPEHIRVLKVQPDAPLIEFLTQLNIKAFLLPAANSFELPKVVIDSLSGRITAKINQYLVLTDNGVAAVISQETLDAHYTQGYSFENISDGYHTFKELYDHRANLFSVICKSYPEKAWRSKLHHDGSMYPDYFIVGITTKEGDYSYHYHMSSWNLFNGIKELEKAPEWDGHKPSDITRLHSLFS